MLDKTSGSEHPAGAIPSENPLRCACNKLLAVIKGNDVEIRCNKCKRYTLIRTRGIEGLERGELPF